MHEPLRDTGSKKEKKSSYLGDNWENLNMGYLLDDTESMSNFLGVTLVLELYGRMNLFSGDLC